MKYLFAALVVSSFCAFAEEGPTFNVSCLVYNEGSGKILKRTDLKVLPIGQGQTVRLANGIKHIADVTKTVLPKGNVTYQLDLTIQKRGNRIAQVMADIDPAKASNVTLLGTAGIPMMTCGYTP